MKVIFLDIDGVLIRFGNTHQIRQTRAMKKDTWGIITSLDEDLMENLKMVLEKTNARIVISSSWRRGKMEILRDEFYRCGDLLWFDFWHRVIWKTPDTLWHGRGNEILTFLTQYHENCGGGNHISHWCVIDDDSFDMKCVSRLWKFVHTKTHLGLTKEKAEDTISILAWNNYT